MFARSQKLIDAEREIARLSRSTDALSQSVEGLLKSVNELRERSANLEVMVEEEAKTISALRSQCRLLESQRESDAACLDEIRAAFTTLSERVEATSTEQGWTDDLQAGMQVLSKKIDWEADRAHKSCVALFERIRRLERETASSAPEGV